MLKQLTKAEYLGASNVTEKMSHHQQFLTAFWSVTCSIYFSNIDILAGDTSKFNFLIKESLSMKHDKPALNWTVKSLLLELFDWFLIILSLLVSSIFTLFRYIYQQFELYFYRNFDIAFEIRVKCEIKKYDIVDNSWCYIPETGYVEFIWTFLTNI